MEVAKERPENAVIKYRLYWLVPVALVAGFWFVSHQATRKMYVELMGRILDNNINENALSVDYINVPATDSVPFASVFYSTGIFSSEFGGYFTLKRKDGASLSSSCEATTIDYTARRVGGGRVSAQIDGMSLMKARGCN
jgi:hypothetical protein